MITQLIRFLSIHRSQEERRSLSKFSSKLHGVKRSFKKILYTWTFYGPELGLCSCMFKYAWFTYPVVPEMTHAMMGRARRMVSGFMEDFWQGYSDNQSNDHYRISNKVAQTTADDYYDYQSKHAFTPFRRVGNHAANLPENVPIVEKLNPKLVNVVDMLKNLQPKANVSDFVIRLARHLKSPPRKPNKTQQFRFVSDDGDEIKYFAKQRHGEATKAIGNATKPAISSTSDGKVDVVGRSSIASNVRLVARPPVARPPVERVFDLEPSGPPPGLPSFDELPPADYTYYENGVHHHVHDLRKNKDKREPPVQGGGWMAFDFEDTILQALGLANPGRSVKPSVAKCSKIYVFNVLLRFIQTSLLG